ncbi:MAG TPA: VOC family protein [Solirubrobacterales bacterium]|nr:VOC family protein [Solirubrobacterales bacterium]
MAVPVSDVDRAKAFYAELLGFGVDHDTRRSMGTRFAPAAKETLSTTSGSSSSRIRTVRRAALPRVPRERELDGHLGERKVVEEGEV